MGTVGPRPVTYRRTISPRRAGLGGFKVTKLPSERRATARSAPSEYGIWKIPGAAARTGTLTVAEPAPTFTVTGTLAAGLTSHGTCTISCGCPLTKVALKMGAKVLLKSTEMPFMEVGGGPKTGAGKRLAAPLGSRPTAAIVARPHGEMKPDCPLAALAKPAAVRAGPGGVTVRLNVTE